MRDSSEAVKPAGLGVEKPRGSPPFLRRQAVSIKPSAGVDARHAFFLVARATAEATRRRRNAASFLRDE